MNLKVISNEFRPNIMILLDYYGKIYLYFIIFLGNIKGIDNIKKV